MQAIRALRVLAVALGATLATAALAGPSLVVDVDTGRVIHAERATDPWYPASVTKLMTAYVALDLVRQGRASMDQMLTVSPGASAQPPSKMGFKPGIQLTLDNALKIIMVKSANDVAQTIAENLGGGSVEGFAALMNDASARLGMVDSRWANPHGLPDDRQWTSARDMAILGRALLRDFPEHRGLFAIGAIKFGRRVMANHNGLMGRYEGADGMKTGFICSSGFNVVASATRGGRRLITVVMGSPNAAERTFRAAELFDQGFASYGWGGQSLDFLPSSAVAEPPDLRPYVCGRRGPIPAEDEAQAPVVGAEAGTGGNSDGLFAGLFSPTPTPSALAFTSVGVPPPRRQLGPRGPLEPVLVWTGASPTVAPATGEDGEKLLAKPRSLKAVASIKPQARPLTRPQPVTDAFVANDAPSIMDDGKGGGTIRPARSLAAKPKRATAGEQGDANPKAAGTAKPARTPATAAAAPKASPKPELKPAAKASSPKPAAAEAATEPKKLAKPKQAG